MSDGVNVELTHPAKRSTTTKIALCCRRSTTHVLAADDDRGGGVRHGTYCINHVVKFPELDNPMFMVHMPSSAVVRAHSVERHVELHTGKPKYTATIPYDQPVVCRILCTLTSTPLRHVGNIIITCIIRHISLSRLQSPSSRVSRCN